MIKNNNDLNKLLESAGDNLVIVKFYADWCNPCRTVSSTLKTLLSEYKNVTLEECNVDEADNDFLSKNHITSIPTMLFYKDGYMVNRSIGAKPYDALKEIIETNIIK